MLSRKRIPLCKAITVAASFSFILVNNVTPVAADMFARNNLKQRAAAKDAQDLPDIEDELIRTHNVRDGGTAAQPLFDLSFEGVRIREEKSVNAGQRIENWMEPNSPTRTAVTGTILAHIQELKDDIADKANYQVPRRFVVDDFGRKTNKRLHEIFTIAQKEGLSREVTLFVGTWRKDTENPTLETQIADAEFLLKEYLRGFSAEMLDGKVLKIKVAFELNKAEKEKIESFQKAHKAVLDWFSRTYPGQIQSLWGTSVKVYAVTPNPYAPLNIRDKDGTFLSHGILFASFGLDFDEFLKIIQNAGSSALVNGRRVDVLMDFKSYRLASRNPVSIKEYVQRLYDAYEKGEISNFVRLIFSDTEGNLRGEWIPARAEGERKMRLAAAKEYEKVLIESLNRDGGKAIVAMIGGGKPGTIGYGYTERFAGLVTMRKGSRSADLTNQVYRNKDAVVGADMVQIASPITAPNQPALQAWKDVIFNEGEASAGKEQTGIAPYLEPGAIVIVMGNALGKQDQDALKAEGYLSLAEFTQAMVNRIVPEKKIRVVAGFNNAPDKWVTSDMKLAMDVIVVGEEAAAQYVIDNYVNKKEGLRGVYGGPLKYARFLELLTKLIIQSDKYLLLGEPLKVLFDEIVRRDGKVTKAELMAFNQPAVEQNARKRYASAQAAMQATAALTTVTDYSPGIEIESRLLRSYGELLKKEKAADVDIQNTCSLITQSCDVCDKVLKEKENAARLAKKAVQPPAGLPALTPEEILAVRTAIESADTGFVQKMPAGFDAAIREARRIKQGPKAVTAIDGEQILTSPGFLSEARKLRSADTENLNIIVAAATAEQARQLEVMGVADIAKIEQRSLKAIVTDLQELRDKKGVIIGLIAEEEKIKSLSLDVQDMLVYRLQTPKAAEKGAAYIAPWTLIFTDLIDRIYDNEQVTSAAASVMNNYGKIGGRLSENFVSKTDSPAMLIVVDVPLIPVTENDIKEQINTYIETVKSI